jgi:hypothetical protein
MIPERRYTQPLKDKKVDRRKTDRGLLRPDGLYVKSADQSRKDGKAEKQHTGAHQITIRLSFHRNRDPFFRGNFTVNRDLIFDPIRKKDKNPAVTTGKGRDTLRITAFFRLISCCFPS